MYPDSHTKKENIFVFAMISTVMCIVSKYLAGPGRCLLSECWTLKTKNEPIDFHGDCGDFALGVFIFSVTLRF